MIARENILLISGSKEELRQDFKTQIYVEATLTGECRLYSFDRVENGTMIYKYVGVTASAEAAECFGYESVAEKP